MRLTALKKTFKQTSSFYISVYSPCSKVRFKMRGTNCKIDCIFVDFHESNDFSLGICQDVKKLYFQSDFGQKIEILRGSASLEESFEPKVNAFTLDFRYIPNFCSSFFPRRITIF